MYAKRLIEENTGHFLEALCGFSQNCHCEIRWQTRLKKKKGKKDRAPESMI